MEPGVGSLWDSTVLPNDGQETCFSTEQSYVAMYETVDISAKPNSYGLRSAAKENVEWRKHMGCHESIADIQRNPSDSGRRRHQGYQTQIL